MSKAFFLINSLAYEYKKKRIISCDLDEVSRVIKKYELKKLVFRNDKLTCSNRKIKDLMKSVDIFDYECKDYLEGYLQNDDILYCLTGDEEILKSIINIDCHIVCIRSSSHSMEGDYGERKNKLRCESSMTLLDNVVQKTNTYRFNLEKAKKMFEKRLYIEASNLYFNNALICLELKNEFLACDCFAYAAISSENKEDWRKISREWYCAYDSNLVNMHHDYYDFNTIQHSYPSISFEKWNSLHPKEKKARALQYAAYSSDNYSGPTDSYWIYLKAARTYYEIPNYERAFECLTSATNRYSTAFHKISEDIMDFWKEILSVARDLIDPQLLETSFDYTYRQLGLFEAEEARYFYLESCQCKLRRFKAEKRIKKYLPLLLWGKLTKFGTSIVNTLLLTIISVLFIFPTCFILDDAFRRLFNGIKEIPNLYMNKMLLSIQIFFGIADNASGSILYSILVISETIFSYFILVALSTVFISWLIRKY